MGITSFAVVFFAILVYTVVTKGCESMQQMIVDTSVLQLPREMAVKITTKQVIIREVNDGLLLMPVSQQKWRMRGMFKGGSFTTERYFEQKRADKELEG
jgi:hypothetical protein